MVACCALVLSFLAYAPAAAAGNKEDRPAQGSGDSRRAPEVDWSLSSTVRLGAFGDRADADAFGGFELIPSGEWRWGNGFRARVEARLRVEGGDLLEPGRRSTRSYSRWSQPVRFDEPGSVELREALIERQGQRVRWSLGKQQIVWGKIDGFKVLDVVNPQSFREFILEDFGSSRTSLWSGLVEWKLGRFRLETVWAPDASVHELPAAGAPFAFTAPRFALPPAQAFAGGLIEDDRDDLDLATYAVRAKALLSGWDLSVAAISGVDPEPLGRVEFDGEPGGAPLPTLIAFHERRNLFGFSAAKAFGPVALRSEAAWRPARHFNVRPEGGLLAVRRLDQAIFALAADLRAPGGWLINLQVVNDRVLGVDPDLQRVLLRPREDRFFSIFARRSFRYDTLIWDLRWYGGTSEVRSGGGFSGQDQGSLARSSVELFVDDTNSLRLEVDLFSGDNGGPYGEVFGQFDRADRVLLSWRRVL